MLSFKKIFGKSLKNKDASPWVWDFCYDGFQHGAFLGWIAGNVEQVSIEIEGVTIVESGEFYSRPDVLEARGLEAVGFSIFLDAKDFNIRWLALPTLSLRVSARLGVDEKCLFDGDVETKNIVNNLCFINGSSLADIRAVIVDSFLWDEAYYAKQLGEKRIFHHDLVSDFVLFGSSDRLSPCRHFSTAYYLDQNDDVDESRVNPFYHYLMFGESEGRFPNPLFDPGFYRDANPDLASWDKSLLAHFLFYGQDEGRIFNGNLVAKQVECNSSSYQEWIGKNEQVRYVEVEKNISKFKRKPLISVIVPVYNPAKDFLIECIESVIGQSYSNWELCLADDCSSKSYVKEVLEHYQALDHRVKVKYRSVNGHISEASNSALEIATGEWVALLDHDDLLHEHALFHVVSKINNTPDCELIYSDEDKIDANGERREPHFKSGWNLDLLYSQNYVSHLGVYKTHIAREIGGFRRGYEGSQDYDFLLRYSRRISHSNVVHIPRVLYHWRAVEGSTALSSGEKSYTTEAGIRALEDHFSELGVKVGIQAGRVDNTYKVNWPIEESPLVTLIIPTYNAHNITKRAIDSILAKTTYKNYEILLVDNNSDDAESLTYFEEAAQHEKVDVLRYPYPFNYSAINNFAAKYARGTIVGLINNDVEVISPGWLSEMVSHAARSDVGCVGAMLYYPNDTVQHAGVILGLGGIACHSHKHASRNDLGYFGRLTVVQSFSAVTAACLLVRKSVFDEVGGLNEKDLTVAYNDVDFCLRVQSLGYRNVWTPYAELYHHESVSRGVEDNPEKIARFNSESSYMQYVWDDIIQQDPYYSPNLSKSKTDFSIAV